MEVAAPRLQIFVILALVIFLLEFLLESASKSFFFWLWRRDGSGFGAAMSVVIMYKEVSLCKNFFVKKHCSTK